MAQLRPVLKRSQHRRGVMRVVRRYPLEPDVALVNHKLRHEVLTVFYGARRFVFKNSYEPLLESFKMTMPTLINMWKDSCASSSYLRNVHVSFEARNHEALVQVVFKLRRRREGGIDIQKTSTSLDLCKCDDTIDVVRKLVESGGIEDDLVSVVAAICKDARCTMPATTYDDDHTALQEKLNRACFKCQKRRLLRVDDESQSQ